MQELSLELIHDWKMGMSVVGNPATSGLWFSRYRMTDLLRPIVGNVCCDTSKFDRSIRQRKLFSAWCERLEWYQLLKRVGIPPEFEEQAIKSEEPSIKSE